MSCRISNIIASRQPRGSCWRAFAIVRRQIKWGFRTVSSLEAKFILCNWLCQLFLMLLAALADRLLYDCFPFTQDGFVGAKLDVGPSDVVHAPLVTLVVV